MFRSRGHTRPAVTVGEIVTILILVFTPDWVFTLYSNYQAFYHGAQSLWAKGLNFKLYLESVL